MKRKNPEDVQKALSLLVKVIQGEWDIRFTQLEVIGLSDLHGMCTGLEWYRDVVVNTDVYKMLMHYDLPINIILGLDLRIVLTWDMDMTDLELHVTEPNGEHCHSFYNHTINGGMLTKDMGCGLGPEVYLIRKAIPGDYRVEVKLFSSRGKTVLRPVTAMVRIYINYGKKNTEEYLTLNFLKEEKQVVHVATVTF
eukprot:TRINITY_DN10551_c0_g1_i2.p1 TRINITY_DN10551_c0_g1~~TRINITY_DN10551_c0_g1_i2.p1  ORF type:complete len:195 (+),score=44.42 TRINITY_DN10551_c0_g1_i2:108-692(+)